MATVIAAAVQEFEKLKQGIADAKKDAADAKELARSIKVAVMDEHGELKERVKSLEFSISCLRTFHLVHELVHACKQRAKTVFFVDFESLSFSPNNDGSVECMPGEKDIAAKQAASMFNEHFSVLKTKARVTLNCSYKIGGCKLKDVETQLKNNIGYAEVNKTSINWGDLDAKLYDSREWAFDDQTAFDRDWSLFEKHGARYEFCASDFIDNKNSGVVASKDVEKHFSMGFVVRKEYARRVVEDLATSGEKHGLREPDEYAVPRPVPKRMKHSNVSGKPVSLASAI